MNRDFTNTELILAREVIASRTGLHFSAEMEVMLNRNLVSAAKDFGYNDTTKFIKWFLSTPLNNEQMGILAAHLTISETYFWREPKVFDAFTQNTLMELVASKKGNKKSINIWCAGCSNGEEAYSIAIALNRTIPHIRDWNITILATDLNPKALSKARRGVYSSWSFRNSPSWLKEFYFKRINSKEYEVIPELKEMVTFSNFNLTHKNFLSSICDNQKMDVIFCRNVLMYFSDEWVTKIVQNFSDSISEDGWLLVSSCELSSDLFPQFTPINFPGAILYRNGKGDLSTYNKSLESSVQESFNPLPFFAPEVEGVKQFFSVDSDLADLNTDDSYKSETATQPEYRLLDAEKLQPSSMSRDDILHENKISIRLLANQGKLEDALSICNEAIASNKLDSGLYFLKASVLQELDKSHEAIKSLKQAIYIYPNYIMGHFALGNLFIRQRNIKNAKRYFNNALELLKTVSKDDILEESEGFSVEYIREIILSNFQKQESL